MDFLLLILPLMLGQTVPVEGTVLEPAVKTDSIRVADPVRYGFRLEKVAPGTDFGLPEITRPEGAEGFDFEVVSPWKLDTLKVHPDKTLDLEAVMVIAPFDEGECTFPPLPVVRVSPDRTQLDTLVFPPVTLEVVPLPVDTASFQLHELKPQMRYPVTFKELLPWIGGGLLLAGLIVLAVFLIRRYRRRRSDAEAPAIPADVAALHALERFQDRKYWAPSKQKAFYSGVTDILRAYIDARFGIGAREMTTAEIFALLLPQRRRHGAEEYLCGATEQEAGAALKALFERADFVKFAKYTAGEAENADVLPTAVHFVTATWPREEAAVQAVPQAGEGDGQAAIVTADTKPGGEEA